MTEYSQPVPPPPVEPAITPSSGGPAAAGNPYDAQLTAAIPVQPWGAQPAAQAIQGGPPAPPQPPQAGQQWQAQQWQQPGQVPTGPIQQVQPGQPIQPGQPFPSGQPVQPIQAFQGSQPVQPWPQQQAPGFDPTTGQWQQPVQPVQQGFGYAYPPVAPGAPAAPAQPSAAATFFKESEAFSGFREVRKNKFGSERYWSSVLRIIGWVIALVSFVAGILMLGQVANLFGVLNLLGGTGMSGAAPGRAWGQAIFFMVFTWAAGALVMTVCMVLANVADDAESSRRLQSETNALLERIANNTENPALFEPESGAQQSPEATQESD